MKTPKLLCLCQQVSYKSFTKIVQHKGISHMNDLITQTGIATGCGKCYGQASLLLTTERAKVKQTTLFDDPNFYNG